MNSWLKDKLQQAKVAAGILHNKVYTGPWNVQIDLTNQCNNDCIACWCNSPLLGDKAMPAAIRNKSLDYGTVINLIDELDEMGVRAIYFTGGGEPFMHPRILDIMRHVKKKGIHLDMSTNFTLVDKKTAEELVDIGIDHMNLSLWAGTPETYDRLHPNKSRETFIKMTDVIDYVVKLKNQREITSPALGMYNVVSCYNYLEARKMIEFAFAHRFDDILFTPVDTVPGRTDTLMLNARQRGWLAAEIRKLSRNIKELEDKHNHQLEFKDYHSFLRRLENKNEACDNYDSDILESLPSCYAGWSFARVLATGDVNSCLKSFKIPIGNIYINTFKEIWLSEKQHEFRRHTIMYDRNNPYFNNMGNDLLTKNQGCDKCCDNLGINTAIHAKLMALGFGNKQLLNIARLFW
jgi:MoaA/NifB/PqqE/SkfB family radical SAM enzyme